MPVILAHGALGPYDELIFGGVAVIFIVMMGISWVKSRNTAPQPDSEAEHAAEPKAPPPADSPDRFRLD
jgi:hypothetical protein